MAMPVHIPSSQGWLPSLGEEVAELSQLVPAVGRAERQKFSQHLSQGRQEAPTAAASLGAEGRREEPVPSVSLSRLSSSSPRPAATILCHPFLRTPPLGCLPLRTTNVLEQLFIPRPVGAECAHSYLRARGTRFPLPKGCLSIALGLHGGLIPWSPGGKDPTPLPSRHGPADQSYKF